jgi:two-component system, OmpR family, sensor histidine kinase SenX3
VSGIGIALVAIGGAVVGALLCLLVLRRPDRGTPSGSMPTGSLDAEVIRRSSVGYLVLDGSGRPLLANARAGELGVIRSGIVEPRIVAAADRAQISGEEVDVEFRPAPVITALDAHPHAPAVHAVAKAIDDRRVLISAHDESAAQRLEAARRDFVANVSHELKTPVSAMGLLAEATADAADDPQAVRRFAGRLQAESLRLGSLVNELIALSRLQGADPLPDMAVVEVDAVIDATIARIATAAENAGITITQDRPTGLLVKGDRALLVTALTNLVDNAINYSPSGTQVSLTRTERDGTVHISVTDRGIGIPVEHHERVFERFFRVDPARSRATGGTGLGLAIVKHVASIHGGSAALWSRPGTGSTLTLRLPLLPATPGGSDTAGAARRADQSAPGPGADSRPNFLPSSTGRRGAS